MLEQIQSSTCLSNLDSHSGNLFLLLLNTLLASQCTLKNPDLYPPDNSAKLEDGDHFDFIVVGTGSSGSVVGSRLTEEKKWKVLVVEAGDYPSVTTEIPAIFFSVQQTDQVWKYSTKPAEKSCLGYKNSICHCTRGKLLGGCSSINGMMYQRGSKRDHDSWYHEGNEGWDYTSLTEFYEKSENVETDVEHVHEYGQKGLLHLTRYKFNETMRDVILQSAEELGYNLFEQEGPSGFFESFQAIKDGVRINSAKAFLGAVKESSELTLALNAHVEKVIIDKTSKEARGIKLRIGKRVMNIYSDKEVILSAGVINSPQILMLSGIGPKNHLQKVGIDVIQNLAVGAHLKDHVVMWVFSKVSDEALKSTDMLDEIYEYFAHRKGMLSHTGVLNIQGYTNVNDNSTNPDILFLYSIIPKNSTTALDIFTDNINLNSFSSEKLREYVVNNHVLVTLSYCYNQSLQEKFCLRIKMLQVIQRFNQDILLMKMMKIWILLLKEFA
ncbi:hypothetical protein WA026_015210 [Henosepilachna vigintioctopunctata]|uniref:Glucose-methanol-choline oxidoreductase N-terminal domain-containing protein n=1 Tax=Henosepilachna vigintioctopunctata TaxID=420089 RepID=A0AAW1TXU6_9CUCU